MSWLARLLLTILVLGSAQGWAAQTVAHPETPSPPKWSAAALYNLANAYARAGKPGLAVLNYERAAVLAPGDPDVEANLLLVRRVAGLPAPERSAWSRTFARLSPVAASWIGLVGLLLVEAAALAGQMQARYAPGRRIATAIGVALIAVTAAQAAVLWPRIHEAVIIAGATPVRISPAPMGDALFALKEAEAVRIAGEHEGFLLVRASGGRTGWVWHADLVPVMP
jgi:hypothetical protein